MPRHPRAVFRLVLGLLLGVVTAFLLPHSWPWEARALLGWNVFCGVNLLRLFPFLHASPEDTHHLATREDETRSVAALITTSAALVSLVGVLFTLHEASQQASQHHDVTANLLTALAVLTVVLSWSLVHAEYTLHYARLFYLDGSGVEFHQPGTDDPLSDPTFLEFAYLSFTIGMTFQVSDMNLNTRAMRKLLLGHALISYLFSAVIVAVTINALAGLLG